MEKTRKPIMLGKKAKDMIFIVTMLAIPVLQFVIFYLIVNGMTFVIAFQDEFTGQFSFIQFERFFTKFASDWGKDGELKIGIANTLISIGNSMLINQPITVWAAYCLYKRFYGSTFFIIAFYAPGVLGTVVTSTMSRYVSDFNGPYVQFFKWLGIKLPIDVYQSGLLMNDVTGRWWFLFNSVGDFGIGTVIIIHAAMGKIPKDIFDVGRLEGIGMWKEFCLVAFPCAWATIGIIWIMTFASAWGGYQVQLLVTGGAHNTTSFGFYLFSNQLGAIRGQEAYNYPAAVGLVLSAVLLPISYGLKWISGKLVTDVEF